MQFARYGSVRVSLFVFPGFVFPLLAGIGLECDFPLASEIITKLKRSVNFSNAQLLNYRLGFSMHINSCPVTCLYIQTIYRIIV